MTSYKRPIKNPLLRRYWIEFVRPEANMNNPNAWPTVLEWAMYTFGIGVTAYTLEDALHLLRVALSPDAPLPPVRTVIENVDLNTLDKHVAPNIKPTWLWRGLWFPPSY